MKNRLFIISIISLLTLCACQKKDTSISDSESNIESESSESIPSEESTSFDYSEEPTDKIEGETMKERLSKLPRVKEFKAYGSNRNFKLVYKIKYEQLIDHDNPKLGTFLQSIEFGFNSFTAPNVYVSLGYNLGSDHSTYDQGENELAFLLKGNYIMVEHRYFGESMPVNIDYFTKDTWKYLSTYQAASDAHDIVRSFKRVLEGKWLSTGASKGGMTTHLYNYYYPGEMDLYVPYVAPFCNSFADTRMLHFLDNEVGDAYYGKEEAAKLRKEVLDFQIKLLEYRDYMAPKFYQEALNGCSLSEYANQDRLFEASVLEFEIGFWQYYQSFSNLESCLALPETTESEINTKMQRCYSYYTSICAPEDISCDNMYTTYYIQAYQELGNYGYDFSHLRDNLTAKAEIKTPVEEEADMMFKLTLTNEEQKVGHKELITPKINEMLKTTESEIIMIHGGTDPWYAVRPDDVEGRDNIHLFVNNRLPHSSNVSSFDRTTKMKIMEIINKALEIEIE